MVVHAAPIGDPRGLAFLSIVVDGTEYLAFPKSEGEGALDFGLAEPLDEWSIGTPSELGFQVKGHSFVTSVSALAFGGALRCEPWTEQSTSLVSFFKCYWR